jgi:hypothetical protein
LPPRWGWIRKTLLHEAPPPPPKHIIIVPDHLYRAWRQCIPLDIRLLI